MNQAIAKSPSRQAVEISINLLFIFLIVAWCLQILMPFIAFIVWGAVIAISIHTPFKKLRTKVGSKLAVTLFVVAGLSLVIVPAWMFAGSLIESAQSFSAAVEKGTFDIRPPNESVREWPVVGENIYTAWSEASENFDSFLEDNSEQLKSLSSAAMSKAAGIGLTVLLFVFSTLIAAAMLANDEATIESMRRFFTRLVGDRAEEVLKLTTATIRSVTMGVLGVAFIQAILLGAGMLVVGVPGTGLWALLILILVIAQLPALIVMAPVIAYVFSVESTTIAVIFAIYAIVGSMSDMVLKPLLLGRGVEAPMLVVLLGAIGGMLMSGILGLFVGAVVLTMGYKLYQAWLDMGPPAAEPVASDTETY